MPYARARRLKLGSSAPVVAVLIAGITLGVGVGSASGASAIHSFAATNAAAWEARLCSTNRTTRRQAYEELRAGGASAVPVLGRLLGADPEAIRQQALDLLCALGQPAVPPLLGFLKDGNVNARAYAARGLGSLAPQSPQAVTALAKAMNDPEIAVVWEATFALAAFRERAAPAVAALCQAMATGDGLARTYAGDALAAIGPAAAPALPALLQTLDDPDPGVRRAAARAIGGIGPPASIPAMPRLVASLKDRDPHVRTAAATALGTIGLSASNALPALNAARTDPTVRAQAEWAMSRITATNPPSQRRARLSPARPGAAQPAPLPEVSADEWPMLGGGPGRNAVRPEANPATCWNADSGENILWQERLGNLTCASPVVAGGCVFIGTDNGEPRDRLDPSEEGVLMAFNADTGRFLWQDTAPCIANASLYRFLQTETTSTPLVEGDRLYYVTAQAQLRCLNAAVSKTGRGGLSRTVIYSPGKPRAEVVWELDMTTQLGVYPHEAPDCSVVAAGELLMVCTGNGVDTTHTGIPAPRAPSFIGVDKRTGRVVWQVVGPSPRVLHGQWSSPSVAQVGSRTLVFFGGGDGWLYALDALTGRVRWRFNGNPPSAVYRPSSDVPGITNRGSIIACPAYHDGRVYLAMGQDPSHGDGMGRLYAIAANGTGDVTHRGRLWEYTDLHRTICTPIIHDGLVYVGDNYGVVHCVDAQTGKRVWAHDQKGRIWGCMVMAGDRLYVGDEDGTVIVYRTGRKLDILARIEMPAPLYGAPAVAGDTMFLATAGSLYAIRQASPAINRAAGSPAGATAPGPALDTRPRPPLSKPTITPPRESEKGGAPVESASRAF